MDSPVSGPERSSGEVQHTVTVSRIYMAEPEASRKDYQAVTGTNPSGVKVDDPPVTNITWYDAIQYCNKRSETEKSAPCNSVSGNTVIWNKSANGYRPPTEAE